MIAGGSDWTVSSLNPLDAMQVAVTRRDIDAPAGEAFIPAERVTLPDIVAAYTRNGAFAFHLDQETGTIETGKAADLVVLDRNIFAGAPEDIHRARVLLTLLLGRTVYTDSTLH